MVSDQIDRPRHQYGKSFPSSQTQYDPGSSTASSPTLSCQDKPQKQSKQQQGSVCRDGLHNGHLYQACPEVVHANAFLLKGGYHLFDRNLKLASRWYGKDNQHGPRSCSFLWRHPFMQNELWDLQVQTLLPRLRMQFHKLDKATKASCQEEEQSSF